MKRSRFGSRFGMILALAFGAMPAQAWDPNGRTFQDILGDLGTPLDSVSGHPIFASVVERLSSKSLHRCIDARTLRQPTALDAEARFAPSSVAPKVDMATREGVRGRGRRNEKIRNSQSTLSLSCHEGGMVFLSDQGLNPVARGYLFTHRRTEELNECHTGHWMDGRGGITYRTSAVISEPQFFSASLSAYRWSNGGPSLAYQLVHAPAEKVHSTLTFEGLTTGGRNVKLGLHLGSLKDHEVSLQNRKDAFADAVSWEGNFKFSGCTDKPGADDSPTRVTSLAELLRRRGELELPGYTNCAFTADVMTSQDLAPWDDQDKVIIPTLRNARITMNDTYADIEFEAYKGLRFGARRILSAAHARTDATRGFTDQADELLTILRDAIPVLAAEGADTRVPATTGYFHARKARIHALLEAMEADASRTSFVVLLSAVRTLNKAYDMIDSALGLVSHRQVKLGDLIEI